MGGRPFTGVGRHTIHIRRWAGATQTRLSARSALGSHGKRVSRAVAGLTRTGDEPEGGVPSRSPEPRSLRCLACLCRSAVAIGCGSSGRIAVGMLAQVADEAGDVVGNQASDRAGGVHADDDASVRVEYEPGRLQVRRVLVDERSGQLGDARSMSALCPTGNVRRCLSMRAAVSDGPSTGDDADAQRCERVAGVLEGTQLGVAVRAPGAAVALRRRRPRGRPEASGSRRRWSARSAAGTGHQG